MMYIGIGMIWIGYGIAVCGMAFGTKDSQAAGAVGVFGALFATAASIFIPLFAIGPITN